MIRVPNFMPEAYRTESAFAKGARNFPPVEKFSIVWKHFFHCVESARPAHGLPKASSASERGPNVARSPIAKKFSMVWKTGTITYNYK